MTNNPTRQPFHVQLEQDAPRLLKAFLDDYPDLLAVTLVPVFALDAPTLPKAFIIGQNGPVRDPVEVIRMSQQMLHALRHQLDVATNIVVTVDNHMQAQAAQLSELMTAIEGRQKELAALEQKKASYEQQTEQPTPPAN